MTEAYYASEEISDMEKEVLSLKHELNTVRAKLNKARLTLAQIYEIVDRVYNWEYDYDVGEIYGEDLKEFAHTSRNMECKRNIKYDKRCCRGF